MNRRAKKRVAILAMLLVLSLTLSSCFIQPDTTVEDPLTDNVGALPFENMTPLSSPTASPTPTPTPSPTPDSTSNISGWESWTNTTDIAAPTRAPSVTAYYSAPPGVSTPTATPYATATTIAAITVRPTATVAATDDGTLRHGSSGTAVSALQQALKSLGYYSGSVDGQFGTGTKAAVIAFQSANGLTADGVAGSRTLNRLYSDQATAYSPTQSPYVTYTQAPVTGPTTYKYLNIGSTGNDVRSLQTQLKQLGYFTGTVNGVYGSDTAAAVMAFQQDNKLWVDGIAGPDTQAAAYGSPAAPVTTASAYRTLKSGLSGSDVLKLQNRLIELGYMSGSASGYYDGTTASAVQTFQQRNGLTTDGIAGSGTQTALYASTAVAASGVTGGTSGSTSSGTLKEGSTGETVYALQERLYDLGYYSGKIDGYYGTEVKNAVTAFQQRNGLTADGVAGGTTQNRLYSANATAAQSVPASSGGNSTLTLKEGMVSDDVMVMQQYLNNLGYYNSTATGSFDAQTKNAVMSFQQTNGLTADGIAGGATLSLLYSGNAKRATGGSSSAATLRQGDEGVLVAALQQRLIDLGYLSSSVDSKFGPSTFNAVLLFQQVNGLTADGIAGAGTQTRLYSDSALAYGAAIGSSNVNVGGNLSGLNNSAVELREQELTGALQTNLSGGGIAASANGIIYYADGSTGGLLHAYNPQLGTTQRVNGDTARFLHASGNTLYYVCANDIIRYDVGSDTREVLYSVGYVQKFSVYNGWFYYLVGGMIIRFQPGGSQTTIAAGINDFVIDMDNNLIYVATADGIHCMDAMGDSFSTVLRTPAQQVLLCNGMVYYRYDGNIYGISGGVSALVVVGNASWFGIYRNKIYYISGSALYTCDTNGQNVQLFDAGPVATVSFVSGTAYLGSTSGGGFNRMVATQ